MNNTCLNESFYEIIISRDNVIDIIREVTHYIHDIIKCDFITVLLNDRNNRYFSILPSLNTLSVYKDEEITIYYNETPVTDIIRTKNSLLRIDLDMKGKLSPGDLKFHAEGVATDLSLPVIYNNEVKLIINLCSYQKDIFDRQKIKVLEEMVSLLSLGVHRIYLSEEVDELKAGVAHWQQRYRSMLAGLSLPVVVLSSDARLIYESNEAFENISGYSSAHLHGMDYARLHPQIPDEQITKNTKERSVYKHNGLKFLNSDGSESVVDVRYMQISDRYESGILAIYHEAQTVNEGEKRVRELSLGGFSLGEDLLSVSSDLDVVIPGLLHQLQEQSEASYVLLYLINQDTGDPELAYHDQASEGADDRRISEDLQNGLYTSVIEGGDCLIVPDIHKQDLPEEWLEKARRTGCRSLISVPLRPHMQNTGILTLLFDMERDYSEPDVSGMKSAAHYLGLIVENLQTNQKIARIQLQNSMTNDFLSSVNATSSIDDILILALRNLEKLIGFDYFSARLFDNTEEDAVVKTLVSKTFSTLVQCPDWHGIEDTDYGWCQLPEKKASEGEDNSHWRRHLKSNMNTILFARNTYVGTFFISSLEPAQYDGQTRISFEQFANQIATIIYNVKLVNDQAELIHQLNELKKKNETTQGDGFEKLLSVISHHLKPDIITIQGLSKYILNSSDGVGATANQEHLNGIIQGTQNLEKLVDDLLELNRINGVANRYALVDMNDVIQEAAGSLQNLYDSAKTELDIMPGMPAIRCDRERMVRVFQNLLDNAVRYIGAHNQQPRVEVGFRRDKDQFLFYVKDNGIGIVSEHHDAVFQLFQEFPHEQAAEKRGHGIGLCLVQKIIDKHNGEIWLESSPDTGSTFTFRLSAS
ncbi:MAG: ATP-binding protein [candidate division KSB1 bacterium]|nr:ATP-binding protein [candidate division KSB1 bacterium]